jgi:hypothetical protein
MYAQFGSDKVGWSDRLMLQLNSDGLFYPFFLDDEDFAKHDNELVAEIVAFMREPIPANWQLSDTPGSAGRLGEERYEQVDDGED